MTHARLFMPLVLGSLLVSACVTVDQPTAPARAPAVAAPAPVVIPPESTPGVSEGLAVGTLPAQRLLTGQCGLFLFTPRPAPRFVFFSEASSGVGRIMLNGKQVDMARTAADGSFVNQHYTTQSFQSGDGYEVNITIVPGEPVESGTAIDSGKMRVDRADGWSVVLPVSGATSCQNR